ncbi:hypothetical protein FOB75_09395 [Vibrio parahaemolyticus]|uniref:Cap15 family cyclic dinucleotide receptor domain-containing protein n=1 Tax=Vibrio parahaemolyticus TaxID=670 RepID=UPI001238AEC4|nr:hypothetical protein [Vibrio parahaemolyticus]QET61108.1 hypothetical protein FOB75_09395 [Vibrio parahaemolyticus]
MWELFPTKIKFGLSAIASISIFYLVNQVFFVTLATAFSYTLTIITFLAWLFGKFLWKPFYCAYFQKKFCPNFNGTWNCRVASNYEEGKVVEFPLSIEADFFSIKMKATTSIGNSFSNYCRVIRNPDDSFQLEYIFQAKNHSPTETDTVFYEGAASLRVEDVDTMKMEGVFWTNRCWHKKMNTAGKIELVKKQD